MEVGDILLCSGTGYLSRRIIFYNNLFLKKDVPKEALDISHVAMLGPDLSSVFEATTMNKWAEKSGVQINPLDSWLKNYSGSVWIRKQKKDKISDAKKCLIKSKMLRLVGTPYENGIPGLMELITVYLSIPGISNKIAEKLRTKSAIHCSESLAIVLIYGEIMSWKRRPNKLPPALWWDSIEELDDYYDEPTKLKE